MVAVKTASRFDSRDLTILSVIQVAQFSHQNPGGYRANIGSGDYVDFRGYGFIYNGGRPTQGTTETFSVYEDSKLAYQFSEMSITIAELIRYSRLTGLELSREIFDGNDEFVGSNQTNYFAGQGGDDTYVVKNSGTRVVEKAGDGNDTVRVDFSNAASALSLDGEALSNFSFSLAANSFIENLLASIPGSTYALTLTGNNIANTIKANAGANVIDGGGGQDVLWGGKGRDSFVFDLNLVPANRDVIKDFNAGGAPDTVKLSQAVFRELDRGPLDASDFKVIKPGNGIDGNDHILYHRKSGWLSYDPDGQGGVAAKVFAKIDNHAVLTFDDFLVVA